MDPWWSPFDDLEIEISDLNRPVASTKTKWTNPSVLLMAERQDPVSAVIDRARALVADAIDQGWSGPPFNPITLAEHLNFQVIPNAEVPEARIQRASDGRVAIEFNPSKPPHRVWYSIAHEIAHTLFPDFSDTIRNREKKSQLSETDWQLEALCNIGAAELLMPSTVLPSVAPSDMTIETLMTLRTRFRTSSEALLIHTTRIADEPCAMFCASRIGHGPKQGHFRVDYSIASGDWEPLIPRGMLLRRDSTVGNCIAIGYTSRDTEDWPRVGRVHVESIGLPPYPSARYPRVVGLLTRAGAHVSERKLLSEVVGNATEPHGSGPRIIVHIVNDKTPRWGGGGFARAVKLRWPVAQNEFIQEIENDPKCLVLGTVFSCEVEDGLYVMSMVAQKAYGPSKKPRIRYAALQACLSEVAQYAVSLGATVHMPLIGTGQAGGNWTVVRAMILDVLCAKGIRVTVYKLANQEPVRLSQLGLDFHENQQAAT